MRAAFSVAQHVQCEEVRFDLSYSVLNSNVSTALLIPKGFDW